jgi:hypothetical protein
VERTVASLGVSALVAFCSLVLSLCWEVLGEPRPARAQTTGTCPNAQLIDTFEGNGNQQTDTFDTTTNSLRVTYNVTGSDPGLPAFLGITVIDANDPDQLSVGSATQEGNGRGETFVNTPAGTYFLDITLFFSGQYTITVEQCEGGNPSRNPGAEQRQFGTSTYPKRCHPGRRRVTSATPGTSCPAPASGGYPLRAGLLIWL